MSKTGSSKTHGIARLTSPQPAAAVVVSEVHGRVSPNEWEKQKQSGGTSSTSTSASEVLRMIFSQRQAMQLQLSSDRLTEVSAREGHTETPSTKAVPGGYWPPPIAQRLSTDEGKEAIKRSVYFSGFFAKQQQAQKERLQPPNTNTFSHHSSVSTFTKDIQVPPHKLNKTSSAIIEEKTQTTSNFDHYSSHNKSLAATPEKQIASNTIDGTGAGHAVSFKSQNVQQQSNGITIKQKLELLQRKAPHYQQEKKNIQQQPQQYQQLRQQQQQQLHQLERQDEHPRQHQQQMQQEQLQKQQLQRQLQQKEQHKLKLQQQQQLQQEQQLQHHKEQYHGQEKGQHYPQQQQLQSFLESREQPLHHSKLNNIASQTRRQSAPPLQAAHQLGTATVNRVSVSGGSSSDEMDRKSNNSSSLISSSSSDDEFKFSQLPANSNSQSAIKPGVKLDRDSSSPSQCHSRLHSRSSSIPCQVYSADQNRCIHSHQASPSCPIHQISSSSPTHIHNSNNLNTHHKKKRSPHQEVVLHTSNSFNNSSKTLLHLSPISSTSSPKSHQEILASLVNKAAAAMSSHKSPPNNYLPYQQSSKAHTNSLSTKDQVTSHKYNDHHSNRQQNSSVHRQQSGLFYSTAMHRGQQPPLPHHTNCFPSYSSSLPDSKVPSRTATDRSLLEKLQPHQLVDRSFHGYSTQPPPLPRRSNHSSSSHHHHHPHHLQTTNYNNSSANNQSTYSSSSASRLLDMQDQINTLLASVEELKQIAMDKRNSTAGKQQQHQAASSYQQSRRTSSSLVQKFHDITTNSTHGSAPLTLNLVQLKPQARSWQQQPPQPAATKAYPRLNSIEHLLSDGEVQNIVASQQQQQKKQRIKLPIPQIAALWLHPDVLLSNKGTTQVVGGGAAAPAALPLTGRSSGSTSAANRKSQSLIGDFGKSQDLVDSKRVLLLRNEEQKKMIESQIIMSHHGSSDQEGGAAGGGASPINRNHAASADYDYLESQESNYNERQRMDSVDQSSSSQQIPSNRRKSIVDKFREVEQILVLSRKKERENQRDFQAKQDQLQQQVVKSTQSTKGTPTAAAATANTVQPFLSVNKTASLQLEQRHKQDALQQQQQLFLPPSSGGGGGGLLFSQHLSQISGAAKDLTIGTTNGCYQRKSSKMLFNYEDVSPVAGKVEIISPKSFVSNGNQEIQKELKRFNLMEEYNNDRERAAVGGGEVDQEDGEISERNEERNYWPAVSSVFHSANFGNGGGGEQEIQELAFLLSPPADGTRSLTSQTKEDQRNSFALLMPPQPRTRTNVSSTLPNPTSKQQNTEVLMTTSKQSSSCNVKEDQPFTGEAARAFHSIDVQPRRQSPDERSSNRENSSKDSEAAAVETAVLDRENSSLKNQTQRNLEQIQREQQQQNQDEKKRKDHFQQGNEEIKVLTSEARVFNIVTAEVLPFIFQQTGAIQNIESRETGHSNSLGVLKKNTTDDQKLTSYPPNNLQGSKTAYDIQHVQDTNFSSSLHRRTPVESNNLTVGNNNSGDFNAFSSKETVDTSNRITETVELGSSNNNQHSRNLVIEDSIALLKNINVSRGLSVEALKDSERKSNVMNVAAESRRDANRERNQEETDGSSTNEDQAINNGNYLSSSSQMFSQSARQVVSNDPSTAGRGHEHGITEGISGSQASKRPPVETEYRVRQWGEGSSSNDRAERVSDSKVEVEQEQRVNSQENLREESESSAEKVEEGEGGHAFSDEIDQDMMQDELLLTIPEDSREEERIYLTTSKKDNTKSSTNEEVFPTFETAATPIGGGNAKQPIYSANSNDSKITIQQSQQQQTFSSTNAENDQPSSMKEYFTSSQRESDEERIVLSQLPSRQARTQPQQTVSEVQQIPAVIPYAGGVLPFSNEEQVTQALQHYQELAASENQQSILATEKSSSNQSLQNIAKSKPILTQILEDHVVTEQKKKKNVSLPISQNQPGVSTDNRKQINQAYLQEKQDQQPQQQQQSIQQLEIQQQQQSQQQQQQKSLLQQTSNPRYPSVTAAYSKESAGNQNQQASLSPLNRQQSGSPQTTASLVEVPQAIQPPTSSRLQSTSPPVFVLSTITSDSNDEVDSLHQRDASSPRNDHSPIPSNFGLLSRTPQNLATNNTSSPSVGTFQNHPSTQQLQTVSQLSSLAATLKLKLAMPKYSPLALPEEVQVELQRKLSSALNSARSTRLASSSNPHSYEASPSRKTISIPSNPQAIHTVSPSRNPPIPLHEAFILESMHESSGKQSILPSPQNPPSISDIPFAGNPNRFLLSQQHPSLQKSIEVPFSTDGGNSYQKPITSSFEQQQYTSRPFSVQSPDRLTTTDEHQTPLNARINKHSVSALTQLGSSQISPIMKVEEFQASSNINFRSTTPREAYFATEEQIKQMNQQVQQQQQQHQSSDTLSTSYKQIIISASQQSIPSIQIIRSPFTEQPTHNEQNPSSSLNSLRSSAEDFPHRRSSIDSDGRECRSLSSVSATSNFWRSQGGIVVASVPPQPTVVASSSSSSLNVRPKVTPIGSGLVKMQSNQKYTSYQQVRQRKQEYSKLASEVEQMYPLAARLHNAKCACKKASCGCKQGATIPNEATPQQGDSARFFGERPTVFTTSHSALNISYNATASKMNSSINSEDPKKRPSLNKNHLHKSQSINPNAKMTSRSDLSDTSINSTHQQQSQMKKGDPLLPSSTWDISSKLNDKRQYLVVGDQSIKSSPPRVSAKNNHLKKKEEEVNQKP